MNKQTHFNSSLEAHPATTSQVFSFQKNVLTFYCPSDFFLWRKYSFSTIFYFQFNAINGDFLPGQLYCPGCFSMLLHSQDGYKTRNHFQALSCVKEEQERTDIQTTVRGIRTYMYYVRSSSTKGPYKSLHIPYFWKQSKKSDM